MQREYHVWARSGHKTFMRVMVSDKAIELRGLQYAVAQAAWYQLMGKNSLGEDINKKTPTRRFLRIECASRGNIFGETEAFNEFMDAIKFQLVTRS